MYFYAPEIYFAAKLKPKTVWFEELFFDELKIFFAHQAAREFPVIIQSLSRSSNIFFIMLDQ